MKIYAVILSAGNGTRFGYNNVNKTAILVNGKPIIKTGIEKIRGLVEKTYVVVGYKMESVISALEEENVVFVTQEERLGTGHAVKIALDEMEAMGDKPDNVLVANGDHLFMIDPEVIKKLLETHVNNKNGVTILTANSKNLENCDNGRIKRVGGQVVAIIEKKDFTDEIRSMPELNTGTYVFDYEAIKTVLDQTELLPNQELYITNVLFKIPKIGSSTADIGKIGLGINTQQELNDYLSNI